MTALSKKTCLLGDFAVGKTSLVRRFVHNLFDDRYISTIGVKVSRKTVAIARDEEIVELTMMLWDLAGSEEFNHVRASYLRGATGAVLVCDLSRPKTLDSLYTYAQDMRQVTPNAKLVVAANKCDLQPEQDDGSWAMFLARVEAMAAELEAPLYMTSALTGDAVETVFRHLGRLLVT